MASGDGEHRMVFDIRGRRRHVVKVVYAILAILMGLSLFLVTGAVNLGSIFGNSNSTGSATKGLEENVEKFEIKVKREPENANAALALTKSQITLANSLYEESEGFLVPTAESTAALRNASESWSQYLELTDEPSAGSAQEVAQAMFSLAQQSPRPNEIEANLLTAAEAQQIVVDKLPSKGSWGTLAIYRNLTFEYDKAKEAEEEALKLTNSKFERENLENEFAEYRKAGKEFEKEIERIEKENKGAGEGQLNNPLGGIGGGG